MFGNCIFKCHIQHAICSWHDNRPNAIIINVAMCNFMMRICIASRCNSMWRGQIWRALSTSLAWDVFRIFKFNSIGSEHKICSSTLPGKRKGARNIRGRHDQIQFRISFISNWLIRNQQYEFITSSISWVTTHGCSREAASNRAKMAIVDFPSNVESERDVMLWSGLGWSRAFAERHDLIVTPKWTQHMDWLHWTDHYLTDWL